LFEAEEDPLIKSALVIICGITRTSLQSKMRELSITQPSWPGLSTMLRMFPVTDNSFAFYHLAGESRILNRLERSMRCSRADKGIQEVIL
jgi:hypothetical protein